MKIIIPTKDPFFHGAEVRLFSEIKSVRGKTPNPKENHEYRYLLRKELSQHLLDCGELLLDPSLRDLGQLPQQQGWSISLTHSPQGSAILALPQDNVQVGVDVEVLERLSDSLMDRIAQPVEKMACPRPRHLFSAKEAAWKALNRKYELPAFSQIETVEWDQVDKNWLTFKIQINDQVLDGQGFSTEIGPICLALYLQN